MAEGGRGGRRAEPPYKPGFGVVGARAGVTTVTGDTATSLTYHQTSNKKNVFIF